MLDGVVNQLVEGFTLIGDAVTTLLIGIVQSFGFNLPDWGARISLLLVSALLIWRFQRMIPKLLLATVCVLAASIFLGFL